VNGTGGFTGNVSAGSITSTGGVVVGGALTTATTGSFSGNVSAASITSTGGVVVGGALTTATTGSFSGNVSAASITSTGGVVVGGALTTATTGSFSGNVSAASITSAGIVRIPVAPTEFGSAHIHLSNGTNELRWQIGLHALESGVDAGSDFYLARYNNYQGFTGIPLTILRTNGNVGLNCNAPEYTLDVNGTARVRQLRVEYSGNDLNTLAVGTGVDKVYGGTIGLVTASHNTSPTSPLGTPGGFRSYSSNLTWNGAGISNILFAKSFGIYHCALGYRYGPYGAYAIIMVLPIGLSPLTAKIQTISQWYMDGNGGIAWVAANSATTTPVISISNNGSSTINYSITLLSSFGTNE
jgi:hypothetical protein